MARTSVHHAPRTPTTVSPRVDALLTACRRSFGEDCARRMRGAIGQATSTLQEQFLSWLHRLSEDSRCNLDIAVRGAAPTFHGNPALWPVSRSDVMPIANATYYFPPNDANAVHNRPAIADISAANLTLLWLVPEVRAAASRALVQSSDAAADITDVMVGLVPGGTLGSERKDLFATARILRRCLQYFLNADGTCQCPNSFPPAVASFEKLVAQAANNGNGTMKLTTGDRETENLLRDLPRMLHQASVDLARVGQSGFFVNRSWVERLLEGLNVTLSQPWEILTPEQKSLRSLLPTWSGTNQSLINVVVDAITHINGNPIRLVHCDPSWRTEEVMNRARRMYDSQNYTEAGALADALEDAECADTDWLASLRQPGPFSRGFFVLDQLLGHR